MALSVTFSMSEDHKLRYLRARQHSITFLNARVGLPVPFLPLAAQGKFKVTTLTHLGREREQDETRTNGDAIGFFLLNIFGPHRN